MFLMTKKLLSPQTQLKENSLILKLALGGWQEEKNTEPGHSFSGCVSTLEICSLPHMMPLP